MKEKFPEQYKGPGSLRRDVASETTGYYQQALLAVLDGSSRMADKRRSSKARLHTNLTTYGRFLHDFSRFSLEISRFFSRCASERERSERERCASSRVPFAISRFFAIFSRFFAIFAIFVIFRDFRDFCDFSLALALRSRIA